MITGMPTLTRKLIKTVEVENSTGLRRRKKKKTPKTITTTLIEKIT